LKALSDPHSTLFNQFYSLNSSWRYVTKSLPILVSIASSLSCLSLLILRPKNRLFLYHTSFGSILSNSIATIKPSSLGYSHISLLQFSAQVIDNLFNFFISSEFPDFCLVFTNGSVSSAGFSVYILKYSIVHSDV